MSPKAKQSRQPVPPQNSSLIMYLSLLTCPSHFQLVPFHLPLSSSLEKSPSKGHNFRLMMKFSLPQMIIGKFYNPNKNLGFLDCLLNHHIFVLKPLYTRYSLNHGCQIQIFMNPLSDLLVKKFISLNHSSLFFLFTSPSCASISLLNEAICRNRQIQGFRF